MKKGLFGILVLIGYCLALFGCLAPPSESIETKPTLHPIPFIDTHNHLVGRYQLPPGIQEVDYEGAARVALTRMNKVGIKRMFIMPPPFTPNHPNRHTYKDFIRTVNKYPDRLAFLGGGGTLNVMIQQSMRDGSISRGLKDRFEKTAEEILSKGAIGFGEVTAEHFSLNIHHPYESAPPDHPLFLLLADIAARHGVPIDIHMEAIPEDMLLPKRRRLESPQNPKTLRANIPAFERLLAHNRKTKMIWAHVGWCNTGRRTPALCAELLKRHPNLYMSFKISPDSIPEMRPLNEDLMIKPEWLHLISAHPERFIIGSDHFYVSPKANIRIGPPRKEGEGTEHLLALLPPALAQKIGYENVLSIFKLDPGSR